MDKEKVFRYYQERRSWEDEKSIEIAETMVFLKNEIPKLDDEKLYLLACRIYEVHDSTAEPFLAAELNDTMRYILQEGLTSYGGMDIGEENICKFLLHCSKELFEYILVYEGAENQARFQAEYPTDWSENELRDEIEKTLQEIGVCQGEENVVPQKQYQDLAQAYKTRIVYLTNSLGEETGHAEIPTAVKEWYENLCCNTRALLYLAQVDGDYGLLVHYEYDECFRNDIGYREKQYLDSICEIAENLAKAEELKRNPVFLGKNSGFEECHEIALWIPFPTESRDIQKMLAYSDKAAYDSLK